MISHLSFIGNVEFWMLPDEVVIERSHTVPIRCRDAGYVQSTVRLTVVVAGALGI
jgi:hypothetical protein